MVTCRHDSATEAHLLTHRRMRHIARGMVGGAVGRVGLDAGIKHVLASRHPYPHLLGQQTLRQRWRIGPGAQEGSDLGMFLGTVDGLFGRDTPVEPARDVELPLGNAHGQPHLCQICRHREDEVPGLPTGQVLDVGVVELFDLEPP